MSFYDKLITKLPEVAGPTQKRLAFKEKLKWTLIILGLFFVLGMIPLFGLDPAHQFQFEQLGIILGAKFGTIISLGIGPIVTASIVLQLLNGSGLWKFDLSSSEGKRRFQGTQKLMTIFFALFESFIYVFMGGLKPVGDAMTNPVFFQMQILLVFQLFLGAMLIVFMDEVVSKWGFGSGVSLFIAAGVSQSLFVRLLSPLAVGEAGGIALGASAPVGAIPSIFYALPRGQTSTVILALAGILSTVVVFLISIYAQSMKVEIPLSFGRIRGHGIRWPLSFIYTNVIPVILIAALMANLQLWARLLQNWGLPLLGTFDGITPVSGLVTWLDAPDLVRMIITSNTIFIGARPYLQAAGYTLIMIAGAVLFSWFWVKTSGMDAKSQAKQMMDSGLQIPGFRKDPRVMERLLNRYIAPLTVMGAIAVGFLASLADVSGALSRGTGILLAVMIIYKLYEDIAKQHMMDMNPMMRKFMGGQ